MGKSYHPKRVNTVQWVPELQFGKVNEVSSVDGWYGWLYHTVDVLNT